MTDTLTSRITTVPAADPIDAVRHFGDRLRFETDASDVWDHVATGGTGVVVVDTRSAEDYAAGHVPGAIHLGCRDIDAATTTGLDRDVLYVTYCAGPHCNGSTKGALALSVLGFSVKEMIGGWWGWVHNGGPVEQGGPVATGANMAG